MKKLLVLFLAVALLAIMILSGCAGWSPKKAEEEQLKVDETIESFKKKDADIDTFFDESYGYVVFPTVGKGAVGVGGAFGKGRVFQKGSLIGKASLYQLTVGFQWGGQAYSEIVFFKDQDAFERFKNGNLKLSAQASAVAVTAGAAATAAYENGVAVFTLAKGGLMYEASIGGQKFTFGEKE